jgi:CheY-like chemotaxis protein
MTNNTYIIEDKYNNLSDFLKIKGIEFTADLITDSKIDYWVRNILFALHPDVERLIIPIRLGHQDTEYIGLRIGIHIRLTRSLKEKQFIPIVFVAVDENDGEILINQIKNNQVLTALLLFTKGVKLIDLFELNTEFNNFPNEIDKTILKNEVLSKLIIPNERGSGHQLSNEWGAFRLAKSAQIELKTLAIPTDLYFKFKFASTDFTIATKSVNKMAEKSKDFNFLIIDDNADKGWTELISHIIGSELINKFTKKISSTQILNFEDAQNYNAFETHDLVFLDLRLKKEEELVQNDSASDLSGLQILKKIKAVNKGIQVIIITASNKAWNMKKLLDEGADAYFIKESIEIDTTDESSKQNYDNLVLNIKNLFERTYLRDLFAKIKLLKIKLENSKKDEGKDNDYNIFLDEIKLLLEQSFDMHYSAKNDNQFAYAYITLYMIIEIINKKFTKQIEYVWYINNNQLLKKWSKKDKKICEKKTEESYRSEADKILGIAIQKLSINGSEKALQNVNSCITRRSVFIHPHATNKEGLIIKQDGKIFSKSGFLELFEIVNLLIDRF